MIFWCHFSFVHCFWFVSFQCHHSAIGRLKTWISFWYLFLVPSKMTNRTWIGWKLPSYFFLKSSYKYSTRYTPKILPFCVYFISHFIHHCCFVAGLARLYKYGRNTTTIEIQFICWFVLLAWLCFLKNTRYYLLFSGPFVACKTYVAHNRPVITTRTTNYKTLSWWFYWRSYTACVSDDFDPNLKFRLCLVSESNSENARVFLHLHLLRTVLLEWM